MTKIIYEGEEINIEDSLEKGNYEFEFLDPDKLNDTIKLPIIEENKNE